jgi:hypothetical protein
MADFDIAVIGVGASGPAIARDARAAALAHCPSTRTTASSAAFVLARPSEGMPAIAPHSEPEPGHPALSEPTGASRLPTKDFH